MVMERPRLEAVSSPRVAAEIARGLTEFSASITASKLGGYTSARRKSPLIRQFAAAAGCVAGGEDVSSNIGTAVSADLAARLISPRSGEYFTR
jgi:hypothetical protein